MELSKEEKIKIKVNSRYFLVIENKLDRRGIDGILHKYVVSKEIPLILAACYNNACSGHFLSQFTYQKVLRIRY